MDIPGLLVIHQAPIQDPGKWDTNGGLYGHGWPMDGYCPVREEDELLCPCAWHI